MRFGPTEQTKGIGDVVFRKARDLAAIVDSNRETLISSKRAQIVNTSMVPQDTEGLWKSSHGIDDSIVGEADNQSGIIYRYGATVISTRESAQVLEFSISPPERML